MKHYILFLFILFYQFTLAQKQDYIWCFGDSAGIDFNNLNSPTPFTSSEFTLGGTASIADNNGNLLFYLGGGGIFAGTFGKVYNRNHQIMQSGDSIMSSGQTYQEFIILPFPSDTTKFYFFHLYHVGSGGDHLYYSVIDMKGDGGLGAVISKNHLLISDTLSERMSAVRHANGRDWWLIVDRFNSNLFYKFLITPGGIPSPVTQNIGSTHTDTRGYMVFSKSGNLFAYVASYSAIVDLFDFDRCSGDLSNWRDLGEHVWVVNGLTYLGCAFSPNEKVLYTSTALNSSLDGLKLYQYDLTASNIKGSKKTIWTYDDTVVVDLGQMMLGPDNKIYLSNFAYDFNSPISPYYTSTFHNKYNENLSVINSPDSLGLACDFQPYSFYLGGKRSYIGLPNMPNYNLGCLQGSSCECIIGVEEKEKENFTCTVYPNPNNGSMQFSYSIPQDAELSIYNVMGEKIKTFPLSKNNSHFQISEPLPAGTYFYQLSTENQIIKADKFVVIN